MIGKASSSVVSAQRPVSFSRVEWLASIAFCGFLPALVLVTLFALSIHDGTYAIDFHQFYRGAEAILDGENPYPSADVPLTASGRPYIYPPFPAIVSMPFTVLPLEVAALVVMSVQVLVVLAIPLVLGVRDWRCYGLVFLWPPVISAIQTGNVTLLFALAAALAWRFRDRPLPVSASLGLTLATKFVLWPLVVWLAATRRWTSAVLTCAVGAGLALLSWAAIGFTGFAGYPDLLRRLEDTVGGDAYTTYVVALDLGAPQGVARAIWLMVGLGLLAAVVIVALRGDERSAFIVAIAAAIAISPIVWLHYFALLLVPVALAQPTLGLVWFVPLVMFVSTGTGNPSPFETGAALVAATVTIGLTLRASSRIAAGAPGGARALPRASVETA